MVQPGARSMRVAIVQERVIAGGRLRSIAGIVEVLNDMGVVPDLITADLAVDAAQIRAGFGRRVEMGVRTVPPRRRMGGEMGIALFNASLPNHVRHYDLLVNTNNSLLFLPAHPKILTYMFYPRRARLASPLLDIHRPETKMRLGSKAWIHQRGMLQLYRLARVGANNTVVAISRFSAEAVESRYRLRQRIPVVYPPVDMAAYRPARDATTRRAPCIVSLGRFSPDKRQLEQIDLAARLPGIQLDIFGFVTDEGYYEKCRQRVDSLGVSNVRLHANAPWEEVRGALQRSRYFLHTLMNEPFGLTAVEALAAGAIPITHDSGGQREVVPDPGLRYADLADVPQIVFKLEDLGDRRREAKQLELRQRAEELFDISVFMPRMRSALHVALGLSGSALQLFFDGGDADVSR